MILFEIGNVRILKEFVSIPEMEWQRPVHRLDNSIKMRDIQGNVCHRLKYGKTTIN
jgi:hypothetical protein